MAFRRSSQRRPRFRRTTGRIPWRALPRSVAKKRRHWITLYNDAENCVFNCLPTLPCGDVPMQLELVSNGSLQTLFGDVVTVKRFVGEFYFRPWLPHPNLCSVTENLQWIQTLERAFVHARFGMVKQRMALSQTPPNDYLVFDPLDRFDWSETRWLKEWRHSWPSPGRNATYENAPDGALIGCCSQVERDEYNLPSWTLAAGNGNWSGATVPEISTVCGPCYNAPAEGCTIRSNQIHGRQFPWWRMNMNMRKTIQLKESDRLDLFGNFVLLGPDSSGGGTCADDPDCLVDAISNDFCRVNIVSHLKMLIEYGG